MGKFAAGRGNRSQIKTKLCEPTRTFFRNDKILTFQYDKFPLHQGVGYLSSDSSSQMIVAKPRHADWVLPLRR